MPERIDSILPQALNSLYDDLYAEIFLSFFLLYAYSSPNLCTFVRLWTMQ
jgi:hypothetical protein